MKIYLLGDSNGSPIVTGTNSMGLSSSPQVNRAPLVVGRYSPYIALLLAIVSFYSGSIFLGELPGDIGDARWTVTVLEHWHQVFSNGRTIDAYPIFAPLDHTLGMSDSLLPQGMTHSVYRLLGWSPSSSWVLAIATIHLTGGAGIARIAKRLLRHPASQSVFTFASVASVPLYAQFGHVQVTAFLLMSWPVISFWNLADPRPKNRDERSFAILLVSLPAAALAAWYGFALGVILIGVCVVAFAISLGPKVAFRHGEAIAKRCIRSLAEPVGLLGLLISVGLWLVFLRIHLPAVASIPEISFPEVIYCSPSIFDLFNTAATGSGPLQFLTSWMVGETKPEVTGISTVSALGFSVGAIFGKRLGLSIRAAKTVRFLLLCVIGTWIVIAATPSGHSLWFPIWDFFPGFRNIRVVGRIQVFVGILVLAVSCLCVDHLLIRQEVEKGTLKKALGGSVLCLLLLDSIRFPREGWKADEYLPAHLRASVSTLQQVGCRGFTMDPWSTDFQRTDAHLDIDSTVLATVSGVPSIDGYTSAYPIGYPKRSLLPADLRSEAVLDWARKKGVTGTLCRVGADGAVSIVSKD